MTALSKFGSEGRTASARELVLRSYGFLSAGTDPDLGRVSRLIGRLTGADGAFVGFVEGDKLVVHAAEGVNLREVALDGIEFARPCSGRATNCVAAHTSTESAHGENCRGALLPLDAIAGRIAEVARRPARAAAIRTEAGVDIGVITALGARMAADVETALSEGAELVISEIERMQLRRKMSELQAALDERGREFIHLADLLPYGIWSADADGVVDYMSKSLCEKIGAPVTVDPPLPRLDWPSYYHPDDRPALVAAWMESVREKAPCSMDARIWDARSGEYRWTSIDAVPLVSESGAVIRWHGFVKDVHEQREAGIALRRSEERLRLLTQSSIDGIWDWEPYEGRLWCSESVHGILGRQLRPDDLSNGNWMDWIHPEDRERVQDLSRDVMAGLRDGFEERYRILRPNGDIVWVRDSFTVVRDEEGRITRHLGALTDVTEVMQIEEQLRRSARLQAIGKLTGGLAHDFNNLLTVILGNSKVLAEAKGLDRDYRDMAAEIMSGALRGADLVRRLLAFARQQDLRPQPVCVGSLLRGMRPLLARTLGANIEISLDVEQGVPPAMVDPGQLESAVLNLCINARQAMPDGGRLVLEAALVDREDPAFPSASCPEGERFIYIGVVDTGSGMDQEVIDRAFEPFFTTREVGGGTGLGLSMVYGFVAQSDGHVDIISEPGVGTTVRMFLPPVDLDDQSEPPQTGGQAEVTVAGGSETILLVEDDETVRPYASRQLRSLGYTVIEAPNAEAAIKVIESDRKIDLLFTDVMMPGMGGRQLASVIRAFRGNLPILFTSGFDESERALGSEVTDGAELLGKPYSRDDLAAAIRRAIDRGARESSPERASGRLLSRIFGRIRRGDRR